MEKKLKTIALCVIALVATLQAKPVDKFESEMSTANNLLTEYHTPKKTLKIGGSVTVIYDDDLLVTSDEGSGVIVSIAVFQGSTLVYSTEGCNLFTCQYTTNLAKGTYSVKVYTSLGSFTRSVTVG